MIAEHTTAVVQRYLGALAGDQPAGPIVHALLDHSVRRLNRSLVLLARELDHLRPSERRGPP
jgi:hypothetical protein